MNLVLTHRSDGWYIEYLRLDFDRKQVKTVWRWRKP